MDKNADRVIDFFQSKAPRVAGGRCHPCLPVGQVCRGRGVCSCLRSAHACHASLWLHTGFAPHKPDCTYNTAQPWTAGRGRGAGHTVFVPAGFRATTTGIRPPPPGVPSKHCPASPAAFFFARARDAADSGRGQPRMRHGLPHFVAALCRAACRHHFMRAIRHFMQPRCQ